MTSKSPFRETEDMDDVTLNYASIMAVTADSPELRKKLQLDNDVSTLKTLKSAWLSEHISLENAIKHDLPVKIESYNMNIADNEADLAMVKEHPAKLDENGNECFSEITLNDKTYTDHYEAEKVAKDVKNTYDEGTKFKVTKEEHYIAPGEAKDDILRNMKMSSEELKDTQVSEQKSSMGIQECAFTK